MFTAEAEAAESVPEPATLAGLGAVAAGFVVSRRRRKTA
ncbi:MAG: PEP-CTERM sorting domain-containing protein [Leptolyngbyaceae cyanobacterium SL_5_9]|nr:PEP-CTERM sorting domain-containing protein [Leptolyngbyaceae cyanobacterium SL_5_9]NJO76317.1 PEP-CTERM sorting domain-containing protein [Leptolyngbyaceae cyanobacterium RM1_406_9]